VEDLLINEFNNFVKKQIPPPEKGKGLRMVLKWGNELINGKSKEAVLEIGFSADKDESNAYGPPINVSFVVDKSGSMAGYDRIEELQKSLINFVGSLRPNDIASLIIFDTEPELLLEAGKLQGRKDEFISLISSIIAGGGTNIYKGMVLGYEQVLKNMQTKGTTDSFTHRWLR
jgi:Ca-activated chloride channel family protein